MGKSFKEKPWKYKNNKDFQNKTKKNKNGKKPRFDEMPSDEYQG